MMIMDKLKGIRYAVAIAAAGLLLVALVSATAASAEEVSCGECSPWWHASSMSLPGNLPPGGEAEIAATAQDLGDADPNGSAPIVVTDKLPAGLTADGIKLGGSGSLGNFGEFFVGEFCKVLPGEVTCTIPGEIAEAFLHEPDSFVEMKIHVLVAANAKSGEENVVSVTGGGGPHASNTRRVTVSSEPSPFGVEQYELRPENADGTPDTQAGSHPFQLTSVLNLNQSTNELKPPAAVKDLRFDLPPGLIGNPVPFPQCPLVKFLGNAQEFEDFCPTNTIVGVASITVHVESLRKYTERVPLFALTPSVGEPARFGFDVLSDPVYLDTSVRTGGDYGVTVTVKNITEVVGFVSSVVTFWGVPGDPRHDPARGWNCLSPDSNPVLPFCSHFGAVSPPPLLTLPTACTGPVHTTVDADSWQQEGAFTTPFGYTFLDNLGRPVGMDGCDQVPFSPSIKVTPDGQAGSTPTGLTVDEHVPQETSINATGIAESSVKGLSVTLPEGVALNPAAAVGLQACSMEQIGLQDAAPPSCPEASKVATVKIKTPLLANPLEGAAYLATQNANPFGSLVSLYIFAEDSVSGVSAKAAGEVLEDPVTGQLTAHFEADPLFQHDPRFAGEPESQFLPEVPFEDVELHFFGGERAPLATPALCGAYRTVGTFSPWTENATTESSSTFNITTGPNGSPCRNPLPFTPALTAGTTSIQAGGFSPFTMTMSRPDGSQNLTAIELKMPPGLLGTLATVKLCKEAEANAGTCGPESLIGHTTVSVGVGGEPFTVRGGEVFITEGYGGAPYGLSIVNPAKAGPFDLGKVIVRAKIEVDPISAVLTITSDATGPYKIPTILDGIPLQIQHVNVTIDRPGFTFNPTNCSPLQIGGSLTSDQGATQALSVPFQITNCAVLAFKPQFKVSTAGKTSRSKGASLDVKLSYPKAAWGTQANIKSVKVNLPKQLPSRLTTLQKACPDNVFEANPAYCPAASRIGTATATTPIIPVALSGPAYFVSHGGLKFPELVIVLSGYGVTVQLHGETFISTKGITSSTFRAIPDVPIGSFELKLPQGPFSALGANANLCKVKGGLKMPTAFTAQNGLVIKQTTPVGVTGCPKPKKKKASGHAAKKGNGRRKG
jgi:hypothetical protein